MRPLLDLEELRRSTRARGFSGPALEECGRRHGQQQTAAENVVRPGCTMVSGGLQIADRVRGGGR
jgi:hypothetical protein